MIDYETFSKIIEGLNTPQEITWKKSLSIWKGTFIIDTAIYNITVKNYSDKDTFFGFKFSRDGSFEMTNDIKKAFTVIPTIQQSIKEFINEVSPSGIFYCATDDSIARKKMYDSFSVKLAKEFSLDYQTLIKDDFQSFHLYKKDYDGIEAALAFKKFFNSIQSV